MKTGSKNFYNVTKDFKKGLKNVLFNFLFTKESWI